MLSDRAFAGSDTLATSYALSAAVRKIGDFDIIIGGRQAIDGDTAQVGPQIAEKLGIPQITYAEDIISADNCEVVVKRRIESGVETVKAKLPLVVTVNGSAAECRPRNAKALQKYKYAAVPSELTDEAKRHSWRNATTLPSASGARLTLTPTLHNAALPAPPTKVKSIENVVFTAKEARRIENNDEELECLIKELIANHTIG